MTVLEDPHPAGFFSMPETELLSQQGGFAKQPTMSLSMHDGGLSLRSEPTLRTIWLFPAEAAKINSVIYS